PLKGRGLRRRRRGQMQGRRESRRLRRMWLYVEGDGEPRTTQMAVDRSPLRGGVGVDPRDRLIAFRLRVAAGDRPGDKAGDADTAVSRHASPDTVRRGTRSQPDEMASP